MWVCEFWQSKQIWIFGVLSQCFIWCFQSTDRNQETFKIVPILQEGQSSILIQVVFVQWFNNAYELSFLPQLEYSSARPHLRLVTRCYQHISTYSLTHLPVALCYSITVNRWGNLNSYLASRRDGFPQNKHIILLKWPWLSERHSFIPVKLFLVVFLLMYLSIYSQVTVLH